LSLTFVEKIAPTPLCPWLLYASWSTFGFAVISVIVSFLVSQQAFQNEIEAVDALWNAVNNRETKMPQRVVNQHTTATRRLNPASGTLFRTWNCLPGPVRRIELACEEGEDGGYNNSHIVQDRKAMPNTIPNVVTTTGASVEIQRADMPTPAMLGPAPQPPAQSPAPVPAPAATTQPTQTTTTK
jgi:hypothetical protein